MLWLSIGQWPVLTATDKAGDLVAALLHVVEGDVFDLYVFRSYADYAWNFLKATCRDEAAVPLFGKQDVAV